MLITVSILVSTACRENRSAEPVSLAADDGTSEIAWHQGDVDSAFAHAKSTGKPMFLYWGAEWCPPCHYLKNKVFKRPEFLARIQDFVPVYLDGDTEMAQIIGERLDVKGYPTVIIFDPLGQEVMRMPSTVPADQYEAVLDAAVASMKPVKTVLTEVLASGPESASKSDLNLLAFYSWGQDSLVDLPLEEQVEAFGRLYRETPADRTIERSRFLGLYLMSVARKARQHEDDTPLLSKEEKTKLQTEALEVLANRELRNSNLLWVDYYAGSIIDLLQTAETSRRQELIGAWQETADAMESDESLSVGDRLSATILKLNLIRMAAGLEDEAELPAGVQEHVRQRAAWAVETVTDESELQTVVNTLAYLFEVAGMSAEAEQMLMAKMGDTAAPYYFMSWIARLKEESGDTEAAIEWHRQAYDSAEGRYSRFRWGSTYLRRLMDLSPDSSERIEADSVAVLGELLEHADAFAGGNYSRLDSLEGAYWSWNEDGSYDAQLATIRDLVHASCGRYPDDGESSQRLRCEAFLVPQEVEGDAAL